MEFQHLGLKDAVRLMHHLDTLVKEIDKRIAADPSDTDYARARGQFGPVAERMLKAVQRYQGARAELQLAQEDISKSYEDCYYGLARAHAWAYARFGHQEGPELAEFGIPASRIGRKRPRRRPPESAAEGGSSAG